jgi:hypothetical protein
MDGDLAALQAGACNAGSLLRNRLPEASAKREKHHHRELAWRRHQPHGAAPRVVTHIERRALHHHRCTPRRGGLVVLSVAACSIWVAAFCTVSSGLLPPARAP